MKMFDTGVENQRLVPSLSLASMHSRYSRHPRIERAWASTICSALDWIALNCRAGGKRGSGIISYIFCQGPGSPGRARRETAGGRAGGFWGWGTWTCGWPAFPRAFAFCPGLFGFSLIPSVWAWATCVWSGLFTIRTYCAASRPCAFAEASDRFGFPRILLTAAGLFLLFAALSIVCQSAPRKAETSRFTVDMLTRRRRLLFPLSQCFLPDAPNDVDEGLPGDFPVETDE